MQSQCSLHVMVADQPWRKQAMQLKHGIQGIPWTPAADALTEWLGEACMFVMSASLIPHYIWVTG